VRNVGSKVEKVRLYFNQRLAYFYNYFLEPLVNLNMRMQDFYEGSWLRIFPATDLEVVLIK
jgi:hypothetical protein